MRTRIVGATVLALALAGCGSSNSSPSHGTSSSAAARGPQRIVSLSPAATESLYAIGAGKQVVAVDKFSDYPKQAPRTGLVGDTSSPESIAHYSPDLVILPDTKLSAGLATLKIPVLVQPAATDLTSAYREITDLGARTSHRATAARVVGSMKRQIATLTGKVPHRSTPLTYYYELDNTLYTVTSTTFVGQLFARAGLRNVADAAGKGGNGYPQLSAETLVKANPDLVFLADTKCCQQNAATFGKRPGFDQIAAVRNHRVVPLDDDIASRWGPRIVDLFRTVVDAVRAVPTG